MEKKTYHNIFFDDDYMVKLAKEKLKKAHKEIAQDISVPIISACSSLSLLGINYVAPSSMMKTLFASGVVLTGISTVVAIKAVKESKPKLDALKANLQEAKQDLFDLRQGYAATVIDAEDVFDDDYKEEVIEDYNIEDKQYKVKNLTKSNVNDCRKV